MNWWSYYRTRALFARIPELAEDKIIQGLGVEQDHPVLVAIMHVLKGFEELAVDATARQNQPNEARAYHAGGIGWLMDAQERILHLAEEGRKRKTGN